NIETRIEVGKGTYDLILVHLVTITTKNKFLFGNMQVHPYIYIFHTIWFTIVQLWFSFMLASFNSWLNILTDHDQGQCTSVSD
ncbi:hypothetical protein LSH36_1850g00000, partial [Paralvinella palmiformis]